MNASTCEYFMQLRMQQLEMIALELNFACLARAIKLPALLQVKVAWQSIFKILSHAHAHTYIPLPSFTYTCGLRSAHTLRIQFMSFYGCTQWQPARPTDGSAGNAVSLYGCMCHLLFPPHRGCSISFFFGEMRTQ